MSNPMRIAMRAADESGAIKKIPKGTNYNVLMALWKRRWIDQFDCLTPTGREALSAEMSRLKSLPARQGLGDGR